VRRKNGAFLSSSSSSGILTEIETDSYKPIPTASDTSHPPNEGYLGEKDHLPGSLSSSHRLTLGPQVHALPSGSPSIFSYRYSTGLSKHIFPPNLLTVNRVQPSSTRLLKSNCLPRGQAVQWPDSEMSHFVNTCSMSRSQHTCLREVHNQC